MTCSIIVSELQKVTIFRVNRRISSLDVIFDRPPPAIKMMLSPVLYLNRYFGSEASLKPGVDYRDGLEVL